MSVAPAPSPEVFDPTLVIILALISLASATVGPVLVAFINRGSRGRADATDDAGQRVTRREYDGLLDQLARLDDENDRLERARDRAERLLTQERLDRAREDAARRTPPKDSP